MFDELLKGSHEVVLVPAEDPQHSEHKVRVVQSHNAFWYRKFAAESVSCRGIGRKRMKRPRTFIKRLDVESAFEDLLTTGSTRRIVLTDRLTAWVNFEVARIRLKKRERRELEPAGDYDFVDIPF